jgi:inorganic pyrophosphatase
MKHLTSRDFLGKEVVVVIDRELGSKHPKHNFIYEVNYGYIPKTKSADGEEIDAYVLRVKQPLKTFKGFCIAIIHRTNDNDDKLIVIPKGENISDEEIEKMTKFQEKWFEHQIIRAEF